MRKIKKMNKTFTFSEQYEIAVPQKRLSYPITLEEWDFIKNKIDTIEDQTNKYLIMGGALLGCSLTALINALIGNFSRTSQNTISTSCIIYWAAFVVTLLIALMAFYFGEKQRKLSNARAKDIIDLMDLFEQKYKDHIEKDGNDKNENYVNEKVLASPKTESLEAKK